MPATVRVGLTRSTGDYGNVRADVEAPIGPDSARVALAIGYDIVSEFLDLAVEAERLGEKIKINRAFQANYAEARQKNLEAWEDQAYDRENDRRGLELEKLLARRAELLEKMRKSPGVTIPTEG